MLATITIGRLTVCLHLEKKVPGHWEETRTDSSFPIGKKHFKHPLDLSNIFLTWFNVMNPCWCRFTSLLGRIEPIPNSSLHECFAPILDAAVCIAVFKHKTITEGRSKLLNSCNCSRSNYAMQVSIKSRVNCPHPTFQERQKSKMFPLPNFLALNL